MITRLLSSASSNVVSATSLLSDVWSSLKTCPSDYYIIATQPGVHATDYSTQKATPRLREKVLGNDKAIRSNITVTEVVGLLDPTFIRNGLEQECGAQVTKIDGGASGISLEFKSGPRVIDITFPALSLHESRLQELSHNGIFYSIFWGRWRTVLTNWNRCRACGCSRPHPILQIYAHLCHHSPRVWRWRLKLYQLRL